MKCEHCGKRLGVPYYYLHSEYLSEYWCEDCLESTNRWGGICHYLRENVSVVLVTEDDELAADQYG